MLFAAARLTDLFLLARTGKDDHADSSMTTWKKRYWLVVVYTVSFGLAVIVFQHGRTAEIGAVDPGFVFAGLVIFSPLLLIAALELLKVRERHLIRPFLVLQFLGLLILFIEKMAARILKLTFELSVLLIVGTIFLWWICARRLIQDLRAGATNAAQHK